MSYTVKMWSVTYVTLLSTNHTELYLNECTNIHTYIGDSIDYTYVGRFLTKV